MDHTVTEYTPPVDGLLNHGVTAFLPPHQWPDYVAMHGLTSEHVSDLIRMATDADLYESETKDESWATVHSRRALGQLRAVEAVKPLLAAMDEFVDFDDFWTEDLSHILGMVGPPAIPELVARLSVPGADETSRIASISALEEIAKAHPEARAEIVALLTAQLARRMDGGRWWAVNGWLADALVELKAVESAAVIEAAFAADVADECIAGGWPSARFRLGLGPEPATNDIRSQWRMSFALPKPPKPPKRLDPKKLLKQKKSRKGR